MDKLIEEIEYITDNIHGNIPITFMAKRIIDTEIFQRLRNISQLGVVKYVFMNANHTRFEHSIGTYHLTGLLTSKIQQVIKQDDLFLSLNDISHLRDYLNITYPDGNYKLDNFLKELIKIAGLVHDLGHGAYSHLFDEIIHQSLNTGHINATHEKRSTLLIEMIIKNDELLRKYITPKLINFIQSLIVNTSNKKTFIYQIVSNSLNGLDVDKFDYLTRDTFMLGIKNNFDFSRLINQIKIINKNICYPQQAIYDIINLYETRYKMHKIVYNNPTVIGIQLILMRIMKHLNLLLNIENSILNMNDFIKLDDNYIIKSINILLNIYKDNIDLIEANKLLQRINTRNFYKLVSAITNLKNIDKNTIDAKYIIFQTQIGYISGKKPNPFKSIYIYNTKTGNSDILYSIFDKPDNNTLDGNNISNIINISTYKEYITMIYDKDS